MSDTTKRLLVFAGPNGSGKSTLTTPETLRRFGIPDSRYLNADDIARRLQTERPGTLPAVGDNVTVTYRDGSGAIRV